MNFFLLFVVCVLVNLDLFILVNVENILIVILVECICKIGFLLVKILGKFNCFVIGDFISIG